MSSTKCLSQHIEARAKQRKSKEYTVMIGLVMLRTGLMQCLLSRYGASFDFHFPWKRLFECTLSKTENVLSYPRAIKTAERNSIPPKQIPLFRLGLFSLLSFLTVCCGLASPQIFCAFGFVVLGRPPSHHAFFALPRYHYNSLS
jgi:hypothetical protein